MMFNSHSNNAAMKAEPQTTTTTPTITSAEDEALKRNTDCVYFLASPLTCKKGAECEYRHSEEARMNPRDCWYWMNGNCLNPKCSFRHPPLDGLLGTSAPISGKPTLPPAQTIAPVQSSAVLNSAPGKQATACYYYQKGLCLKGDRCPFMHGSQSFDNQAPQAPGPKVTAPVAQPQMLKKDFGGLQRCTREKNPQANIAKPIEAFAARPPTKAAPANNGFATEKRMSSSAIQVTSAEHSRNKPVQLSPIISRNSAFISGNSASRNHSRQVQPLDDRNFRNVKEPDEFLAESSPGFDVLVDDELRDSDYYQNEEEFRRMTGHGGKHPNNMNEFEYERSADYSLANFEREKFSDPRSYDRYGRAQEQYAWEQRRVSSERISDMSHVPDRRGHPRSESPDQIDESDLRFRLSKHRKINGSRSATSPDRRPDRRSDLYRRDDRGHHVENQRNRNHNRRDSHHLPPQESSISNRLQGRISVLGRSSPDRNHNDSHRERGMDRSWARLSPGRPSITSYRGKSQESIKHRIQEDFTAEGRNFRGPLIRRDDLDYDTPDFAPPKRLAELKGPRVCEHDEEQQTKGKQIPSLGERKNMRIGRLVGHQELEGSISFEGPKPLSEILKRKRGDDISSGNKEERNRKREEDQVSEKPSHVPSHVNQAPSSKEENKFAAGNSFVEADDDEEEGLIPAENAELTNNKGFISVPSGQKHETDDMLPDKTTENENEYDQGEEEFEYEQEAGEEENADPEDEYLDDEDDFAKKIGVMFS